MTQETVRSIDWADPFALSDQLNEDERMVREAAHAYAQDKLLPRVTEAFRQAGFDATSAANRARLAYSAYVGFIQLAQIGQPRMSHDEFETYIRDFIAVLIPS